MSEISLLNCKLSNKNLGKLLPSPNVILLSCVLTWIGSWISIMDAFFETIFWMRATSEFLRSVIYFTKLKLGLVLWWNCERAHGCNIQYFEVIQSIFIFRFIEILKMKKTIVMYHFFSDSKNGLERFLQAKDSNVRNRMECEEIKKWCFIARIVNLTE